MRLFVAIPLPPESKARLQTLAPGLAALGSATLVKPPALHLTLRFLGDRIDPIRLPPIQTALASVRAAPFELALYGVGRFPPGNKRPARVLWVGIREQPALMALQEQVEQALAAVDFPPETQAYHPHVTLARLKGEGASDAVRRLLDAHAAFDGGGFRVNEFQLMSSLLTPQGAVYRPEATYPLAAPASEYSS